MDVKSFISSGILESYTFGMSLTASEQEEVETAAQQHPEIKAVVTELQQLKEKYALLHTVRPPADIKDRLMDIVLQESTPEGNELLPPELRSPSPAATPVSKPVTREKPLNGTPARETPVKQLSSKKSSDRIWKYLTAAIVALLIGSVVMNFFFFNRSTDYKSRYKSLVATKQKLDAEKESQALTSQQSSQKDIDLLKDPAFKWIRITGNGKFSGLAATVCWNPVTHMVFLIARLMPVPPAGKQFQLWAVINNKFTDAGVFETGADVSNRIQQMKPVADATAFAITLEKAGGSSVPDMEQLYITIKMER